LAKSILVFPDSLFGISEVTSVAMSQNGSLLLTSSKDNSNRLWDVRTVSAEQPKTENILQYSRLQTSGTAHQEVQGASKHGEEFSSRLLRPKRTPYRWPI